MTEQSRWLINGKWTTEGGSGTFEVRDPANGDVVGTGVNADPEDAERAIEAAHAAFKTWSRTPPPERGEVLKAAARMARERQDELGELLSREQGKPLSEAKGEVDGAAGALEFFGEESWRIQGETMPTGKPNRHSHVVKQPYGVVTAISPWNYPLLLMSWKLGPALVTGNTVVAKPPTETPLALTKFIGLLAEAGAPNGVVNIVTGGGKALGPALAQHPNVAKIAITGQTETGKKVMEMAASGLKRVSLELGNHTPLLVFDDADVEAAAKGAAKRAFRNAGQVCNSINRIYVHNSIKDSFVEKAVDAINGMTIDRGLNDPDVGAMCTASALEKPKAHVQDALSKGAQALTGGGPPEGDQYANGNFFAPTLLDDVNHDMLVMQEETFGPVAGVMGFDSVDEAIDLANDTPYGLVAYVYTQDLATTYRASQELEYGTIGVNNVSGGNFPFPYAGWKQSGIGVENSHYATEQYLQLKHVRIDL
ncbi:MAG: aldehyde dehydrogenase [Salinibacter sp.]